MRTPARVFGLLLATVVTFAVGTAAAMADTPSGPAWPKTHNRSTLGELVVFGGFTIALYVVIVLFGMLTARKNFTPAEPGNEIHVVTKSAPAKH